MPAGVRAACQPLILAGRTRRLWPNYIVGFGDSKSSSEQRAVILASTCRLLRVLQLDPMFDPAHLIFWIVGVQLATDTTWPSVQVWVTPSLGGTKLKAKAKK